MKHPKLFTALTLLLAGCAQADQQRTNQTGTQPVSMTAEQIHAAITPTTETYKTPLGLAYVSNNGDFVIDNTVLVRGKRRCAWSGNDETHLSIQDYHGKKSPDGYLSKYFLLSEIIRASNCGNYIVDLTGTEPRVSNRFGDSDTTPNASGQYVKINWKEKKPTIRFRVNSFDDFFIGTYHYDPATGKVTLKDDE